MVYITLNAIKVVENLILKQRKIRYAVRRKNSKYLRTSLLAIYLHKSFRRNNHEQIIMLYFGSKIQNSI